MSIPKSHDDLVDGPFGRNLTIFCGVALVAFLAYFAAFLGDVFQDTNLTVLMSLWTVSALGLITSAVVYVRARKRPAHVPHT